MNLTDKQMEILKEISKVPGRCGEWGVEDGKLFFQVNGFSKSGTVKLIQHEDYFKAIARYGEKTTIRRFEALIDLAYDWYVSYLSRGPFSQPSEFWKDDLIELGLIKEKNVTVYETV